MAALDGLLTLLALCGLCLFLSERLDLRISLLPLPVLAGSVLWLCLGGFAGLLLPAAWVWLAAAVCCTLLTLRRTGVKKALARLWEPGFLVFVGGAVLLWVLFWVTQPRFILWDEFTFWGSACKMTKLNHMLHPAAPGNVAARAGMPGLMLVTYLFQFLSRGFAEWKCFAAYDTLYLAALVTLTAAVQGGTKAEPHRWPRVILLTVGAVLLPYFFTAPGAGGISTVYLNVMGDTALGLVFGGALCLYFLAGRTPKGLVLLGLTLSFLTLIKDVGFAYSFIVIALAAADQWLAADHPGLKSFGRAVGSAVLLALVPAGLFVGWSRYVLASAGIDKNAVGSAVTGDQVSYGMMFTDGIMQLLGRGSEKYAEKFAAIRSMMLRAFTETDVCLLGSGLMAVAVIFAVLALAFVFAQKGPQRRRVGWFALFSPLGYLAFVVFHLFLYVYNFTEREAMILKDYDRYIGPFYMGWLLAALCLLALSASSGKYIRLARLACLCVVGGIVVSFGQRSLPSAGFWNYPHQNYSVREEVTQRAEKLNDVLDWDDTVFLISQGDDATRWYYYGYELNAVMGNGYGGSRYDPGSTDNWETTFANLTCPYTDEYSVTKYGFQSLYQYTADCDRDDLESFLRDKQYTHLLLDQSDLWIYYEMADFFTEKPPMDRTEDAYLYEIDYDGPVIQFVPVGEVRYEAPES